MMATGRIPSSGDTNDESAKIPQYDAQKHSCTVRQDDQGWWNFCKAWHWYPLHLALCIAFLATMLSAVDGHAFRIASSPRQSGIYQAEMTALISIALVTIRLVAAIGSVLIVWRLAFILIEKTGISLSELCRLIDMRIPLVPQIGSGQHIWWSLFALMVIVFVWPASVAAPLATASVQWVPSSQLLRHQKQNYTIQTTSKLQDWGNLANTEVMSQALMRAMAMDAGDENRTVAVNVTESPRRFLNLSPPLSHGGVGNLTMPFFEVTQIRWLNASFPRPALDPTENASLSGLAFPSRTIGTIGFLKQKKLTLQDTLSYNTTSLEVKQNVTVFVGRILNTTALAWEGDEGTEKSPCYMNTSSFGKLPYKPQIQLRWNFGSAGPQWATSECWAVAEITIRAGSMENQQCDFTLVSRRDNMHIAVPVNEQQTPPQDLVPDFAMLPTLDLMTDVLRNMIFLGVGLNARINNVEGYIKSMLTAAYYPTREGLLQRMYNGTDSITVMQSEPVIRASIERGRLYWWFALNSTLSIAAVLLWVVSSITLVKAKTIRDPTLVALTMDINEISHHNEDGLCNAVALRTNDKKLTKMEWDDVTGVSCRKLRLVGKQTSKDGVSSSISLLSSQHDIEPR